MSPISPGEGAGMRETPQGAPGITAPPQLRRLEAAMALIGALLVGAGCKSPPPEGVGTTNTAPGTAALSTTSTTSVLSTTTSKATQGTGGAPSTNFDAGADAADAGDAGITDAGTDASDASTNALSIDGGEDAGFADAGQIDAGTTDAGPSDAGPKDAGAIDAGAPDAGTTCADAGAVPMCPCPPDAGVLKADAGARIYDAGVPQAQPPRAPRPAPAPQRRKPPCDGMHECGRLKRDPNGPGKGELPE